MEQATQPFHAIEESELKRLLKAFKDSRTPEAVYAATASTANGIDAFFNDASAQHGIALACKDGCNYCCHLRLDALPSEIFRIKAHLERTLSKEALASLKERIVATAKRAAGLTAEAHSAARIACSFLADGRCSIY